MNVYSITCMNIWAWKSHQQDDFSARCRELTVDQKRAHIAISKQCLDKFDGNLIELLQCSFTVDKTGTSYNTPGMEAQHKQRISSDECAPKKSKQFRLPRKIMALVFWNKNIYKSEKHSATIYIQNITLDFLLLWPFNETDN